MAKKFKAVFIMEDGEYIVNIANMNVRKNTIPSVQEKTRTSLMICSQQMILMERIY